MRRSRTIRHPRVAHYELAVFLATLVSVGGQWSLHILCIVYVCDIVGWHHALVLLVSGLHGDGDGDGDGWFAALDAHV